jgi:rhodanese-related sulfurtransferase
LQVKSVEPKEALRLQKENNFVILDVRPEAEFKEVSEQVYEALFSNSNVSVYSCCIFSVPLLGFYL